MKITKFGHCCLLLEVHGKRILVDPGRFSTEQNALVDVDIILITHEHSDHFHTESVQTILDKNPHAQIITNSSVAKLLAELDITAEILEGDDETMVSNIPLHAHDGEHEEIVGEFGKVQNTGYLVDGSFFFPGDAYTTPKKPVDILALPVAGPWCKISDAITYARTVAPRIAFPVHDATLSDIGKAVTYPHFERELNAKDIGWYVLEAEIPTEL